MILALFLLTLTSTAIELDQRSINLLLTEADDLIRDSRFAEASKKLSQAIASDQNNPTAYFKRSISYILSGKQYRALADLDTAIRLDPSLIQSVPLATSHHTQAYPRRARILCRTGLFSEAIADLDAADALGKDPGDRLKLRESITLSRSFLQRAKNYQKSKQWTEAAEAYRILFETAPDWIDVRIDRATCMMELGEWKEVISDAARCLLLDPDHLGAMTMKAKAHRALGELTQASDLFSKCARSDMDGRQGRACRKDMKAIKAFLKAYDAAGDAWRGNRIADAVKFYEEAMEIDSMNPHQLEIDLRVCEGNVKLHRRDETLMTCDRGLHRTPGNVNLLLARARSHVEFEDYASCTRDCALARNKEPGNQAVNELLQKCEREQKKAERQDHYVVLNVPRDATLAQIKSAYRKLAKEWHPDKHMDDEEKRAVAEAKFRAIALAYEVLTDPEKRRRFNSGEDLDVPPPSGGSPFGGGGFNFHFSGGGFKFG